MAQIHDNVHFLISPELIKLLQWLLENETSQLKRLITHVLNAGFKDELAKDTIATNDYQKSVVHFFSHLENLLHETIHEHCIDANMKNNIVPEIFHVDMATCNIKNLALSINKASSNSYKKNNETPKDIFCKELLKRWKPTKDQLIN